MLRIQKYKNRKFYQRQYGWITLGDIWQSHGVGEALEVRCAVTKLDVTEEVLALAAYTYLSPHKRKALIALSEAP